MERKTRASTRTTSGTSSMTTNSAISPVEVLEATEEEEVEEDVEEVVTINLLVTSIKDTTQALTAATKEDHVMTGIDTSSPCLEATMTSTCVQAREAILIGAESIRICTKCTMLPDTTMDHLKETHQEVADTRVNTCLTTTHQCNTVHLATTMNQFLIEAEEEEFLPTNTNAISDQSMILEEVLQ